MNKRSAVLMLAAAMYLAAMWAALGVLGALASLLPMGVALVTYNIGREAGRQEYHNELMREARAKGYDKVVQLKSKPRQGGDAA